MELDLERVMILLQRRYNSIRELDRLTDDLAEAVSRNDDVSARLVLQMRADEIEKCSTCWNQICELADDRPEQAGELRRLILSDPFTARPSESFEEQKIFEVRQKSVKLIERLKEKDRVINQRVGGEKSYYARADR